MRLLHYSTEELARDCLLQSNQSSIDLDQTDTVGKRSFVTVQSQIPHDLTEKNTDIVSFPANYQLAAKGNFDHCHENDPNRDRLDSIGDCDELKQTHCFVGGNMELVDIAIVTSDLPTRNIDTGEQKNFICGETQYTLLLEDEDW
jgi:hypothetical protein